MGGGGVWPEVIGLKTRANRAFVCTLTNFVFHKNREISCLAAKLLFSNRTVRPGVREKLENILTIWSSLPHWKELWPSD
jgi:hypothetical protein